MTDCSGYAYFSCCYRFHSPYICMVQYLVKQTLCSSFILIYFVVNTYIVNKALKSMGAQPPEIEHHIKETVGLRKPESIGLYHRHTPEVSAPGEPLGSHGREVGVVASLLLPHTPPRTLRPVHETRGASLHMLR